MYQSHIKNTDFVTTILEKESSTYLIAVMYKKKLKEVKLNIYVKIGNLCKFRHKINFYENDKHSS